MKTQPISKFALSLTSILLACSSQAATVGYWRMENNFNNESGTLAGSGGNLTAVGDITTEIHTDAGTTDFFDPVPSTGASNEYTASGFGSGKVLWTADSGAFDLSVNNAFTAEALIRPGSLSSNRVIAAQWIGGGGSDRSWLFMVTSAGQLRMLVSQDGTTANFEEYVSTSGGLGTIQTNRDYYVASSFSTSGVTMYLQDLSDSESTLKSQDFGVSLSGVRNAGSGADFTIGAYGSSGSITDPFSGSIDEVRLSNAALPQSELMVIPEPSSLVMMFSALAAMVALMRRRARR